MKAPVYTKEDMKVLADMSRDGSPAKEFLIDIDYDPKKFRKTLKSYHLTKDIEYLFQIPREKVPLLINKGEISGYLRFRFNVGK